MRRENGHEARRRRTRAAIVASATELFERQGFTQTTVSQIAESAQVSERTFYVHFPTKEDLLFDHVREFARIAWQAAGESHSGDPVQRVGRAMRALIDASSTDEAVARLARTRAELGRTGEVPRSLAAHLVALATGLIERVAAATSSSPATVAPMVGAAIGAVEAAGLLSAAADEPPGIRRRRMLSALESALRGFSVSSGAV